jgi:hypothetical protein
VSLSFSFCSGDGVGVWREEDVYKGFRGWDHENTQSKEGKGINTVTHASGEEHRDR